MQPALSTAPSSGQPPYRKKPALDDGVDGGVAAGVLFVAPDGDVLLLRRSNAEANFAGHWALPGGGIENGETPEQGAARECSEEMDVEPEGRLKLLDRRRTPTGLTFHTFASPAAEKFVPKLNGEHSGYAWASLDSLPGPLHPAVEATLRDRVGMAGDMTPEDWTGLREGFAKWTREEEAEPEHADDERIATDSVLRLALDRESVREFDRDGRLRVKTANLSKATVNPYRGAEIPDHERLGLEPDAVYQLLRDPAELEKAAASFCGVPLLKNHVPVSANDHQPGEVVGAIGTDCRYDAPYLKGSLSVWAADAIEDIESDAKKELSSGYHYRADMTPGIFNGMRYDGVMRDIVGNHVALVENGRAGPDVVVGDSRANLERTMKPTRLAHRTLMLTTAALLPRLAMDAKPPKGLLEAVSPLNSKNFAAQKPKIVEVLKTAKLAKDASLEGVLDLVDALEGGKMDGADESVSEEQHNAMEAAAHGESDLGIPKKVGQEFVDKDKTAGDAEGLKKFLTEKGMGQDDIDTAMSMFPTPAATDEEDEEAKKKAAAEAAAAKPAEDEKDEKDMVTKPAMDAAIKVATEATAKQVRETERGIRAALAEVTPIVGELSPTLALDSAEDVYRHAAIALDIPDAATIHASALPTLVRMHKRSATTRVSNPDVIAQDAAGAKSLNDRFGLDRIQAA